MFSCKKTELKTKKTKPMKKLLLSFLLIAICYMAKSQAELNVFEEWTTNAGSQNFFHKAITKTDGSGNVYVAGATVNGSGNYDILVAKYNSGGVQQWIQQYNGYGNYHDVATAVFVDGSGNVYLTGTVTDSLLVQGSDIITMKYNSSGSLQWATRYNGSGNFHDSGADIVVDGSGNVYITGGIHTSTSIPYTDAVIIKYNSSGTQQWATIYNNTTYNKSETGARIRLTSTNKAIVSGAIQMTTNTYIYGALEYNMTTGAQVGGAALGTGTSNISYFGDLAIDVTNGNAYIAGAVYDSVTTGYDYYLVKLDSSLAIQWEKTYDGGSNLEDMANEVKVDAAGSVYITGYTTSSTQGKNIATRKYNSSGAVVWTQGYNDTLNGDDAAMAMTIDADANIYITGYDSTYLGSYSYITIKYDSTGTEQWKKRYDGMSHQKDKATNIALDTLGNIIVTGLSETAPATYEYTTLKYVEKYIITPTDALGETASNSFLYYENKGQLISTDSTFIPDVRFYTNNTYPNFYFKNDTMSMVFASIDTIPATDDTLHRIDMVFINSNANKKVYPMKEQSSYLNYFLGHCPNGVTGIHGNQQLVIPDLYDNIDLIYSSNQNGIKYYFVVKPGGKPKDIYWQYFGATSTYHDNSAQTLEITSDIGSITFDQPFMYQINHHNDTINGSSQLIEWTQDGTDTYLFANYSGYDDNEILIIEVDQGNGSYTAVADNIGWSTYIGGSSGDQINDVKSDANNNLFVVGKSLSFLIPGLTGVLNPANAGNYDGFVIKFKPSGEQEWYTFIGGNREDGLNGLDIASNGDIYSVGYTFSNFSMTPKTGATNIAAYVGPYDATYGWLSDGFIFQLVPNGLTCPWRTYFNTGNSHDVLSKCKFDANGNFFIVGITNSSNATITGSSPQYIHNYTNYTTGAPFVSDGYIARFNQNSSCTWSTCIGSSNFTSTYPDDELYDLDFDSSGNLYVVGRAVGSDYPNIPTGSGGTASTNYSKNGTDQNGVITKFTNTGNIIWSSYVGSSAWTEIQGICIKNDIVYFTGTTNKNDIQFYNSGQYYYSNYNGSYDAFFAVYNSLNQKNHLSYLGGFGIDEGWDIKLDQYDNIYVSGKSKSTDFPTPTGGNPANSYDHGLQGSLQDYFVSCVKLGFTDLLWSTLVGGDGNESSGYGFGVSIDVNGLNQLHLTGQTTSSSNFPLNNGGGSPVFFQGSINGFSDGTITRFDLNPVQVVGIEENTTTNNNILVYPSPTSSFVNIKTNNTKNKVYSIYNTLGQVVMQQNSDSDLVTLDLKSLTSGMYILVVVDKFETKTFKIIKN